MDGSIDASKSALFLSVTGKLVAGLVDSAQTINRVDDELAGNDDLSMESYARIHKEIRGLLDRNTELLHDIVSTVNVVLKEHNISPIEYPTVGPLDF